MSGNNHKNGSDERLGGNRTTTNAGAFLGKIPLLKLNYNFATCACKCRKREVNFHVDNIWDKSYIHGRNNGKT